MTRSHEAILPSNTSKCDENYVSDQCALESTATCKCANCGGPHPANYRDCPALQKLRQPQHKAIDEITLRKSNHSTAEQPPPALLTGLSDQITLLDSRLISIEETISTPDWTVVSSHSSRRHHMTNNLRIQQTRYNGYSM
ncbi:hypothetical protein V9T40_014740 [Parthenolecanium corni]|uniref:Uncharacterized protein n=1 Tax=Parthenolecanium corni TaxID=536013 RepID=A0AAN9T6J7_9HEMI